MKETQADEWLGYGRGGSRWLGAGVAVMLLTVLAYSNSLQGEWHFDDYDSIVNNESIQSWEGLEQKFGQNRNRIVGYFSLALDYSIGQDEVRGYHLTNLGIHLVSGWLVWGWVLLLLALPKMKGTALAGHREAAGLLAASVFWLHPVQTQAVNYLVQRFELLAGFFVLAGVNLYLKGRLEPNPVNRAVWLVLAGISLVLAMFTKESAFCWVLLVLLVEGYGFGWSRKRWKYLLASGVAVAGFLVLLVVHEYSLGWFFAPKQTRLGEVVTSGGYLLTQTRVAVKYAQLLAAPVGQNFDYYFPISTSWADFRVWLGTGFLGGMVYLAWRWRRRYRSVSLGILWILASISVSSSILPIEDVIFEHRLYLATAGFGLIAAELARVMVVQKKASWLGVGLAIVLVYGGLTHLRNRVWQTELALWSDTVKKSPQKARVQNQVGVHLQKAGRLEEAIGHYQEVLKLNPEHADVHYNLGQAMLSQRRFGEAREYFAKAVELNPQITRAYHFMGVALIEEGEEEAALEYFDRAIAGEPDLAKAYEAKGDALAALGRLEEAREAYGAAVALDPEMVSAKRKMANLEE